MQQTSNQRTGRSAVERMGYRVWPFWHPCGTHGMAGITRCKCVVKSADVGLRLGGTPLQRIVSAETEGGGGVRERM